MRPLDSLAKRDLLAAKKFDPQQLRAYAEEFFSQERYGDAFEFFRKLQDREGMLRVKQAAMELGDHELLWRIAHAEAALVTRDDWLRCGEKAMARGKFRSALYVFERLGDAERVAAAQKAIADERAASTDQASATR